METLPSYKFSSLFPKTKTKTQTKKKQQTNERPVMKKTKQLKIVAVHHFFSQNQCLLALRNMGSFHEHNKRKENGFNSGWKS